MNNRTVLFVLLIFGAFFVARPAVAQDKAATSGKTTGSGHKKVNTPEERMDNRLKLAKSHLGLTDEQVSQLRSVLAQNQDKLQADRKKFEAADSGSTERKAARKQLKADRTAMMDQLKGVLNEEQMAKFKKMKLAKIDDDEERVATKGERKAKSEPKKKTPKAK